MEYKIPVKNKETIVYAYVDEDDYDKCSKIKWHLTPGGYSKNGSNVLMHRYILHAEKKDPIIDHIDGNRLNNRKCNIIFSTPSRNAQNKPKVPNTTSKYIGVHIAHGKWKTALTCNNICYTKLFDEETHAAYYYDILAVKYHGENSKTNKIPRPEGFVMPEERVEKILPKGISLRGKKYRVRITYNTQEVYLGSFKTLEDAIEIYNKKDKEIKEEEKLKRMSKEIQRNSSGSAIINISYKDITKECIIDDDVYHDIIKYSWNMSPDGYAKGYVEGIRCSMHRYIMRELLEKNDDDDGEEDDNIIDHIDNNRLNNCKNNLRIASHSLNSHNKKSINEYKGVILKENGTYGAEITKDGKRFYNGSYDTKIDAARAYDKKATELYGSDARLNLPDEDNSGFQLNVRIFSTKYIGYYKDCNKYRTYIIVNKIKYYLGLYDTEEEAALAYNNAVITHGLDRKLNIISVDR
jgi:hypothetical protein